MAKMKLYIGNIWREWDNKKWLDKRKPIIHPTSIQVTQIRWKPNQPVRIGIILGNFPPETALYIKLYIGI